jgi:hypothetical protein
VTRTHWIIIGLGVTVVVLAGVVLFLLGRMSIPPAPLPETTASLLEPQRRTAGGEAKALEEPSSEDAPTGPPFTETFDTLGISLTFVPTRRFRRLVEYRTPSISQAEDSSCSAPYVAEERVVRVTFAWDFVIDRFRTWNEREGQQEYIVSENQFPSAWQGSLHDLVADGRKIKVTKQRCGQGQVPGLIAVAAAG